MHRTSTALRFGTTSIGVSSFPYPYRALGSRVQASGLLHVADLIGATADVLLKVDGKNVAHTTMKRSAPTALIASDTAEPFDHAFDLASA